MRSNRFEEYCTMIPIRLAVEKGALRMQDTGNHICTPRGTSLPWSGSRHRRFQAKGLYAVIVFSIWICNNRALSKMRHVSDYTTL